MILAVHSVLATLTTIREFELEEDEARKLSNATKDVLQYYPVGLSDKALAWANLGIVACGVYGTRMMAYSVRRRSERMAAKLTIMPSPGTPPRAQPAPAPAGGKVNGHAGALNFDDLTPPWMTQAPEGEVIP